MYFIDTNIFLELEFEDARWKERRDFLSWIEDGKISDSTSDFVVDGGILQIENKKVQQQGSHFR